MATYPALALLELDLEKEPSPSDASRLQKILTSATQKFAKVAEFVFLQPGEEVKVVPAAEGEKEVGTQKVVIKNHPDGSGYALALAEDVGHLVLDFGKRATFQFHTKFAMRFQTIQDASDAIEVCPGIELGSGRFVS